MLPGQTCQIIRMVPEKEGHIVDLQWAIPPQQQLYRSSPCGYLGHLLGWGYTDAWAVVLTSPSMHTSVHAEISHLGSGQGARMIGQWVVCRSAAAV